MATELLRESGSQEEIGVNWSQKFLQRRSELISVFSQTLDKERAAMHNDQIISAWFILFEQIRKKHDIQLKDIYNMNEKDFALGLLSKHRVICSKDQLSTMTQDGNRE